jgi:hypothetical protein
MTDQPDRASEPEPSDGAAPGPIPEPADDPVDVRAGTPVTDTPATAGAELPDPPAATGAEHPGTGAEATGIAAAPVTTPATGAGAAGVAAAPVTTPATDYTDAGVPTLGYLQDKIDRRYGTALGATELAGAGDEAKAQQQAAVDREQAARDRLAEIRRSLHGADQ